MTDPNHPAFKIYNGVVQFSILAFTLALVYFAFVYYPKAVKNYKTNVPAGKPAVAPVAAGVDKFPIETKNYRIVYETKSDTYYVFIFGQQLDAYLLNKNSAMLTLKNTLSADSLCSYNIVYASADNIEIPQQYQQDENCN